MRADESRPSTFYESTGETQLVCDIVFNRRAINEEKCI